MCMKIPSGKFLFRKKNTYWAFLDNHKGVWKNVKYVIYNNNIQDW